MFVMNDKVSLKLYSMKLLRGNGQTSKSTKETLLIFEEITNAIIFADVKTLVPTRVLFVNLSFAITVLIQYLLFITLNFYKRLILFLTGNHC